MEQTGNLNPEHLNRGFLCLESIGFSREKFKPDTDFIQFLFS
jgi:hypothetical protein